MYNKTRKNIRSRKYRRTNKKCENRHNIKKRTKRFVSKGGKGAIIYNEPTEFSIKGVKDFFDIQVYISNFFKPKSAPDSETDSEPLSKPEPETEPKSESVRNPESVIPPQEYKLIRSFKNGGGYHLNLKNSKNGIFITILFDGLISFKNASDDELTEIVYLHLLTNDPIRFFIKTPIRLSKSTIPNFIIRLNSQIFKTGQNPYYLPTNPDLKDESRTNKIQYNFCGKNVYLDPVYSMYYNFEIDKIKNDLQSHIQRIKINTSFWQSYLAPIGLFLPKDEKGSGDLYNYTYIDSEFFYKVFNKNNLAQYFSDFKRNKNPRKIIDDERDFIYFSERFIERKCFNNLTKEELYELLYSDGTKVFESLPHVCNKQPTDEQPTIELSTHPSGIKVYKCTFYSTQ
jgi:hypothetical protein